MGFTSRAQMRTAQESGSALFAKQGKRGQLVRVAGPVLPEYAQAGFRTETEYKRARNEAAQWSHDHSHVEISRFKARIRGKLFKSYYHTYVKYDGHAMHMFWLEMYLVYDTGYMTPEQFQDTYGESFEIAA